MQRKGKGPAYKMVGVRVPEAVKAEFDNAADELGSNSSLVGHVLILEFLREISEIRAKGGRVVWPIKLRVAYDPKPEVRFGDLPVPMVAEGSWRERQTADPEKSEPGPVSRTAEKEIGRQKK